MNTLFKTKMNLGISLVLSAAVLQSFGLLFWKISHFFIEQTIIFILFILLGFILQGFGLIFLTISFRYGKLSVLHPMLSFGYILAPILGFLVLEESLAINQILGIIFIITGIFLVSKGKDND